MIKRLYSVHPSFCSRQSAYFRQIKHEVKVKERDARAEGKRKKELDCGINFRKNVL